MKLFAVAAVAAALAVPVATAANKAPAAITLDGTVGPGFTIKITVNGQKLARLKAGTYTIKISDDSDQHDFHLYGPGVNKMTSISGKPKLTWHVTLKRGHYTYVCDPHSAFMKGSFTVV